MKYNLDDLFERTPKFNSPILPYMDSSNKWTFLASKIFSPIDKIKEMNLELAYEDDSWKAKLPFYTLHACRRVKKHKGRRNG